MELGSWELPPGPPIAGEEPAAPGAAPDAAPQADTGTGFPASAVDEPEPYESPAPLASLAHLGLVSCAVVAAGAVVSDVAQYVFADAMLSDPTNAVTVDRLSTSDLWQGLLSVLAVLVFVPTATGFVMWESRVYRNLPALGARHLQVTPGWVVAAWFIPVLNLIWPKLIIDEAWRSSALVDDDPVDGRADRVPAALHVWWGCLVGAVVLWLTSSWLTGSVLTGLEDDPGSVRLGYAIEIVASSLALVAAVLGAGLVRDLTTRQVERAGQVNDADVGSGPVVQPTVVHRTVPGYPPPPSVPPVAAPTPPFPRYP